MKNIILILFAIALVSCSGKNQDKNQEIEKAKLISKRSLSATVIRRDNCSKSANAAKDAEKYAKRAQNSDNFEAVRDNAEEAMDAFEKAAKFSDKCGCNRAEKLADKGYKMAKKAYRSENLNDAREYAEDARSSAEDLVSQANNCSYD